MEQEKKRKKIWGIPEAALTKQNVGPFLSSKKVYW